VAAAAAGTGGDAHLTVLAGARENSSDQRVKTLA
jgi:hypothetical protein